MKKPTLLAMFLPRRSHIHAFTLIELMLSTAVLALLMALMLTVVGQTQQIWVRSSGKVAQFQASRTAFEAMTRNLSQATLNTYYDLQFDNKGGTKGYSRNSDLHFVSGKAAQSKFLGTDSATYPTHAVFFQAPLGLTGEMIGSGTTAAKKYRTLGNLLSAAGYYIKWGKDDNRPPFITSAVVPDRYRCRLMEVIQPAESFGVADKVRLPKANDWIQTALGIKDLPASTDASAPKGKQDSSRALAENIVALIILPKMSDKDTAAPFLAPNYDYDSRPADAGGTPLARKDIIDAVVLRQFNQLPPVVRVTMVAIDEPSAIRQQSYSPSAPTWTKDLFSTCVKEADVAKDLGDPAAPKADTLIYRLAPPAGTLPGPKMNYRIYTMDVIIRGSKWSS